MGSGRRIPDAPAWLPDYDLDFGSGFYGTWWRYSPYPAEVFPSDSKHGLIIVHRCKTESGWDEGSLAFDLPIATQREAATEADKKRPVWQVVSWDPLELSPSIVTNCACGAHGWIRGGRWTT